MADFEDLAAAPSDSVIFDYFLIAFFNFIYLAKTFFLSFLSYDISLLLTL